VVPVTSPLDLPGAAELIARVRRFLVEEVVPAELDPSLTHRIRVAANLLGVAERELALQPAALDRDGRAATVELVERYASVADLAERLETGDLSVLDPEVFAVLDGYAAMKTTVAQIPRSSRPEASQ
jgi:hypothetical protein